MDVFSILGTYTTPAWITSLSTDFADVGTMASDVAGSVAPVIIAVLIPVIGIKLVKKFANKIG